MSQAAAGRSLRLRLLLGCNLADDMIWRLVLAGWAVVDALHLGHDVLEKEPTDCARQVLIVADTFRATRYGWRRRSARSRRWTTRLSGSAT